MHLLKIIADNQALLDELRAHLLSKFTDEGLDTKLDDKQLGELVRARLTGRKLVDDALRDIQNLKGTDTQPLQNPAR